MAAETPAREEPGFGQVSRTVGIVFQYVLFAATTLGLFSLAVLLLYVTNDALEPFEADAGWYLIYLLTFLLPVYLTMTGLTVRNGTPERTDVALPYVGLVLGATVGAVALSALRGTAVSAVLLFVAVVLVIGATVLNARTLARGAEATWGLGLRTLGVAAAGPFVAGSMFILFELVAPVVWFAHVVAAAAATAALVRLQRTTGGLSSVQLVVAGVVGYGLGLVGIPSIELAISQVIVGGTVLVPRVAVAVPELLPSLAELILRRSPVLPSRVMVYALTLVVPAGILASTGIRRSGLDERLGRDRLAPAAGGATVVVAVAGGIALALAAGLAPASGVVVVLGTVVPIGYFAATRGIDPAREGTDGLALPAVIVVGAVLGAVLVEQTGLAGPASWLDWQFLVSLPSPFPEEAGFYPALVGSILLMLVVVLMAFPVGVGAAVYLEEYTPDNAATRFIQVNISNLAGVPSVVYGLLGLGLFINLLDLGIGSVLVGGVTLALLILPIVIISAQEAIRSVPDELRQASYGMGATRYQTVRNVVLPRAFPGILTGTILAVGRAIGETAPLIMIGAANVTFSIPKGLGDSVSAMPMQVYTWAASAKLTFQDSVLAAGVVTLVVVLVTINSIAIVLRNRFQID